MERMMKVQDVLLKAMAKKITWWAAAEMLGVRDRPMRPRRPMAGMLLHIDGSKNRWLNNDCWYDLIVILDDATSEIYYAQLVAEESTRTVMAGTIRSRSWSRRLPGAPRTRQT